MESDDSKKDGLVTLNFGFSMHSSAFSILTPAQGYSNIWAAQVIIMAVCVSQE